MIILLLLLIPLFLHSEDTVSHVYAHILVKDCKSACEEAIKALRMEPDNKSLWEAYIQALAKEGDEGEAIASWRRYLEKFPEENENRRVLENIGWGVIEKGARSSSPIIRNYTLLAAYLGQDARGVSILHAHLKEKNARLRTIAVSLSSEFRDDILKEEIYRLLNEERNWRVRLEVISAAGKMKIYEARQQLLRLVSDPRSSDEEKGTAIEALVNLLETANRSEVEQLAKSSRAGLRLLACKVVAHADLEEYLDLIIPLLKDHNADVRLAAVQTIGILRAPYIDEIEPLLNDRNTSVVIMAAWALTLNDSKKGQAAFVPLFSLRKKESKRLAASALAATGKYGFPLTEQVFDSTDDPYVKMNLALSMIGERKRAEEASRALYEGFVSNREKWMWDDTLPFKCLAKSTVKHQPLIPNTPEVVNRLTRLEILNILALMEDPRAYEAVKHFLREKGWGISGMASALLLTEGDDAALDLVEALLEDPDSKIRVQAALILAFWGGGDKAVETLQEAYYTADRDLKERILESLGHVGALSSIPFLVDRLEDPHQSVRMIAAASLIRTLYH